MIQKQQKQWLSHNFPKASAEQQLLGVVEETGELGHVILKMQQSIRGKTFEDGKDAIGDILVYLCGYCNLAGIGFDACYEFGQDFRPYDTHLNDCFFSLLNHVNGLCRERDKSVEIRLNYVIKIINNLINLCVHFHTNVDECLKLAWETVSKRDWVSNPKDGKNEQP